MDAVVVTSTLPEVDLVALSWGDPKAPLALCLHGFPDCAWTWRHLGPLLVEAGYHAVAPYTRGYAPSGLARDGRYDIAALAADAVALRERLAPDTDAVVVGHDWGGITVQAVAADPDLHFRRAVSLAIPPLWALSERTRTHPGTSILPLLDQSRRSWYIGFNQLPLLPEAVAARLVRRLWRSWSPGYDPTGDLAGVLSTMTDPAHRTAIFGYYRALRQTSPDAAWLQEPVVPTLHLHGADDGCFSPKLARGAGSRMVDDAGHFLHLERPDTVNSTILEFLAG